MSSTSSRKRCNITLKCIRIFKNKRRALVRMVLRYFQAAPIILLKIRAPAVPTITPKSPKVPTSCHPTNLAFPTTILPKFPKMSHKSQRLSFLLPSKSNDLLNDI